MKSKKNTKLSTFYCGVLLFRTLGVFVFRWLRAKLKPERPRKSTAAFDDFLKVNGGKWREIDEHRFIDFSKAVMVEAIVPHDGYFLTNLVIARYLMCEYDLPGVGLLVRRDKRLEKLFGSYGITEFIYLEDREKKCMSLLNHGIRAVKLVRGINSIDDLFNIRIGDIYVGKLVYDHYLRTTGMGTLEKVNWRVVEGIIAGFSYLEFMQNFFDSGRYPALVQSERQFIPGGFIFQSALKNKVKVYVRGGGPTNFTLRCFEDLSQAYCNIHRYSKEVFNYVDQNFHEIAAREGGNFVSNRFAGQSSIHDIPDASLAFSTDKKMVSREELCDRFKWNKVKPIVGIMANALTDGVFTNRWRLFRDNLTWLRSTLQTVRHIDHVNWFVKAHPSDIKNMVKTTTKSEYDKWVRDCPHVMFLPNDVRTSSLPDIVDVIITDHGSAGIEYSTFGIPCVIAGEALYSGRGFVHEPQSKDEYFETLKRIDLLGRLSTEQIERAKIFAYIYLILSRVSSSLIPSFNAYKNYDEAKLWVDATRLISKFDPQKDRQLVMLDIQIGNNYRHLLNYDWIGWDKKTIGQISPDLSPLN